MLFGKKKPKKEKKETTYYTHQLMRKYIDLNDPEGSVQKFMSKFMYITSKVNQNKAEGKNEYDSLTDEEIEIYEHMKKNVTVKKMKSLFKQLEKMRFCPKCGRAIPFDASICSYCGKNT